MILAQNSEKIKIEKKKTKLCEWTRTTWIPQKSIIKSRNLQGMVI